MLLAAGAGRRAGGPKALRRQPDGTPWVVSSLRTLLDGGCSHAVVVLGCGADAARALLDELAADLRPTVVEAPDWAAGMSHSLRTGLNAAERRAAAAVLIHLVDLPDVGPAVVQRLVRQAAAGPLALARATYDGRSGHPVLVGSAHLAPMLAALTTLSGPAADTGARSYLAAHDVVGVECGDLATGRDRDGAR